MLPERTMRQWRAAAFSRSSCSGADAGRADDMDDARLRGELGIGERRVRRGEIEHARRCWRRRAADRLRPGRRQAPAPASRPGILALHRRHRGGRARRRGACCGSPSTARDQRPPHAAARSGDDDAQLSHLALLAPARYRATAGSYSKRGNRDGNARLA